ncbi:MAG: hypothetical protein AAGH78_00905 [Cyanobacteria bacterium P01_H01_bin.58]
MLKTNVLAKSRRRDPNYMQACGDLPKPLALKLKAVCVLRELSQSEALEAAVIMWLESLGEEVPEFEPPADFEDKRRKAEDD